MLRIMNKVRVKAIDRLIKLPTLLCIVLRVSIFVDTVSNILYTGRMKYRAWICLSGLIWFGIGMMLLYKGLHFIADGTVQKDSLSHRFFPTSVERGAMTLLGVGLLVGFVKGRFVLVKTVRRMVLRIVSLPLPLSWSKVYPVSYYVLIAAMMGLGMGMKRLPLPVDLRGMIDVAIGSALIHGAMLYFRAAITYGKSFPSQSQGLDRAAPRGSAESSDA